jgi:hypothetical protein
MPTLKRATPTPGPWIVKTLGDRNSFELGKLLILADDQPLAMLAARPGEIGPNARLMAAAPALIAFAMRAADKRVPRTQLRAEAHALLTAADVPGFRPIQASKPSAD